MIYKSVLICQVALGENAKQIGTASEIYFAKTIQKC